MTIARIKTVAFQGIDILKIDIQVHMANSLPNITVISLPDMALARAGNRSARPLAGTLCSLDSIRTNAHTDGGGRGTR